MDDAVLRAIAKWPNVPACWGWLALDRRGRWRMRDEYAQTHGLLGDVIRNATIKAFIDRNYARTDDGAWYFQNGPQRVFVDLEAAPFVYFVHEDPSALAAHTGAVPREIRAAYLDDAGNAWVESDIGPGIVSDRDLARLFDGALRDAEGRRPVGNDALERVLAHPEDFSLRLGGAAASIPLRRLAFDEAAARFGYRTKPRPPTTVGTNAAR